MYTVPELVPPTVRPSITPVNASGNAGIAKTEIYIHSISTCLRWRKENCDNSRRNQIALHIFPHLMLRKNPTLAFVILNSPHGMARGNQ